MPNEDAGELLKHILNYVNDEHPETENLLVKMAFGHMKPLLKKDLKKWDEKINRYRKMGKASAEKRRKNKQLNTVEPKLTYVEPKNTVNVNDNVNVNVNVNDNVNINSKKNGFSFRKSLLALGIDKTLVDDFIKNRKLKRLANTETAFNKLVIELNKNEIPINELMDKIVSNGWGSFKNTWLEKEKSFAPKKEKESAWDIIQKVKRGEEVQ